LRTTLRQHDEEYKMHKIKYSKHKLMPSRQESEEQLQIYQTI